MVRLRNGLTPDYSAPMLRLKSFWGVMVLTAFMLVSKEAQASLRVYPVAVELSKAQQSSQLTVTHDFEKARWVEISPQFFEMTSSGQMVAAEQEQAAIAPRSAVRMLRFSPKRFLLKPGESQVVKLRSRIPSSKEDGIYRVHLKFTPDEAEPLPASNQKTQISSQLSARISIAIPVYISKGNVPVDSSLSDSKIVRDEAGWSLETNLNLAKGDMVRGNIFTYIVPSSGEFENQIKPGQKPLSRILGVATYVAQRKIRLALGEEFQGLKKDQALRVEFRSGERLSSKLMAEDFVVGK